MRLEDHQREIAENRHRDLPEEELHRRIRDLSHTTGSNPGQINRANQLVAQYREELERRSQAKRDRMMRVAAIAGIVAAVAGVAGLVLHLISLITTHAN